MNLVSKSNHLARRLPSFSLSILKQCCACSHGDAAAKPFSAIPGPKPWPIIGNSLEMRANYHNLLDYIEKGFREYGDIFKLTAFGNRFIVIKDPDSIEQVLRAEGKYPVRDTTMTNAINWLSKQSSDLPPSFLTQNGEEWKRIRTAIGKQATPKNVQSYYSELNAITHRFTDYIKSIQGENGTITVNIAYLLKLLFIELAGKFTYGNDLSIVSNPSEEYKALVVAVDNVFEVFGRVMVELPLYKLYNNEVAKLHKEAITTVEGMARKEAKRLFERLEAGEMSETPGLLEQWLMEGKLSQEQAIQESMICFVTAVDSTASQTIFLMHHMATRPEIQERLYQEVKEVMGDSKNPTPQQLSQMPYLKGCILEAFRLQGATGVFPRVTAEAATILGYAIPAKTNVFYSVYSAGRDEKLFHDPLKFEPERWKNKEEKHAFAIQPFGFGPRSCYGRRFAELKMKLLLVHVTQNFKMSTNKKNLKTYWRLAVAPESDIPVQFIARD